MIRKHILAGAAILALAMPVTAALAHPPIAADAAAASFEQDRADILAMAGNYKVRFDMQETTPWDPAYTPLAAKTSGGHEVVRVIEDTGRKIMLQHLLVVSIEGKSHIIKHWRQDWEYEPAKILAYSDRNSWEWEDVPERMRTGRWSQTVWQVDDSPAMPGGASLKRRRAFAAGVPAGPGARWPGAMPCAIRFMTGITPSIATNRRRPDGFIGRTTPKWG